MKDRIKALRKHLKISQDVFGRRIGISGASVSRLESGENEPSPQTIVFICKEFGVSERWLRDGAGDMFERPDSVVDKMVKKFSFPEIVGKLLYTYDQLNAEQQDAVLNFAQRFIATMINEDAVSVAASIAAPETREGKEARNMIAERMNQEESSVLQNGKTETA